MLLRAAWLAAFLATTCLAESYLPLKIEFHEDLDSELANIRVLSANRVAGVVTFTYGSCASESQYDLHHEIASAEIKTGNARLVWLVPEGAPTSGCVSAWNGAGDLVGRSRAQDLNGVKKKVAKRAVAKPIHMTPSDHFDPLGPWFDGIKFVSQREPSVVDVQAAKSKEIAIVGAGISGLMTYLILQQSGLTNITIVEANDRIGGRIHTSYLSGGPSNYSYQDLGAMKLPLDYTDPVSGNSMNISDFQLVYALIEEMNRLNAEKNESLLMDVVPWLEESQNGLQYFNKFRLPSGLPPTVKQIQENASLHRENLGNDTLELSRKLDDNLPGQEFMVEMAKSMYKAHREWTDGGLGDRQKGGQWSEFAFLSQHLHGSLNSSDILSMLDNPAGSFWNDIINTFYESCDNWRMIDGGFSRLPKSFEPLIKNDLRLNTKVERIDYQDNRLSIWWRQDWRDTTAQESKFDYAVISVPFTVVRQWRLPSMGATMRNAVQNLVYDSCCKVILEYSERFWEKLPNPIYGGCSTETDIPGVGFACYPNYMFNSTGPATIIGSYAEGTVDHGISRLITMSDEEHAQYILDAMSEIHGEHTRQLYTGKFARKCWALDPFTAGGWASPNAGQHELYMPEYFKVHSNMIFVGEHTSFTHGWISSALDSSIRGAVQLLLELGLIDEARAVVRKWMAGWIKL
ncbi:hypothetical protein E4U21_004738 [Claviceps maximensis]|nr:hypothetical protein E4U21_004738 [Claviceps maximensis]